MRPIPAEDKVRALLVADIHLSHRPPIARAAEPDWYAAMERQLFQLRYLSDHYRAPVICAGDVFDDGWRAQRCPPELINFAIDHLPMMYAVPGQHDLPYHRLTDIKKSAYWTLVQAGKIVHLRAGKKVPLEPGVYLHGFPWGTLAEPLPYRTPAEVHIAVCHRYIWVEGLGHVNAPKDQHLHSYRDALKGYDLALFGDNHHSFQMLAGDCQVVNPGSFFRRRSDELHYVPRIGLLLRSGQVLWQELDVSEDKLVQTQPSALSLQKKGSFEDYVNEMLALGESSVHFVETVRRFLNENVTDPHVKRMILECLQDD